jgi:hypothetical protein
LMSALLLTSLSVEAYLGSKSSVSIIKKALVSIGDLYKFQGNNFDGYIIRWDPVTREDGWIEKIKYIDPQTNQTTEKKNPFSTNFLIDPTTNNYIYCAPQYDPRYRQNVEPSPDNPPESTGYYGWRYHFRQQEPSMDEMVGLIASYSIVYNLVKDSTVQSMVKDQVSKLADYLDTHGYLLARPYGGFSFRGASGLFPGFQYPFSRLFARISGRSFSSNTSFEDAMKKSNVWKCFGDLWLKDLGNVGLEILLEVLLFTLLLIIGPNIPIPPSGKIDTSQLPGIIFTAMQAFLQGTGIGGLQAARAKSILDSQICFDTDQKGEFAIAYILKQMNDTKIRFNLVTEFTAAGSGAAPAVAFIPFVALTALGDNDSAVKDSYLKWLKARRQYDSPSSSIEEQYKDSYNISGNSCFASALSLLLGGGGKEEEQTLVSLLNKSYSAFHNNHADDLPISFNKNNEPCEVAHSTPGQKDDYVPSALDYMAGLSLAWLYSKRQADSGDPVTTPGFPTIPNNIDSMPKAVIPKEVWQYYQQSENPVDFRIVDIQNTSQVDTTKDLDLFADNSPDKSKVPPPVLAPIPDIQKNPDFDSKITVNEGDTYVFTGVYLKDGDIFEFSEISGSIWAGVLATGRNGPDGWNNVDYDPKFFLHGYMDPVNAHPYCLIGKLNNYFFVGSKGRGKERFLYPMHPDLVDFSHDPIAVPLYVRINDDQPHNGDGSFSFRLKVWKSSIIVPLALPLVCRPIDNQLTGLLNELKDLSNELNDATGSQKSAIVQAIKTLNTKIAAVKKQLQDCINQHKND